MRASGGSLLDAGFGGGFGCAGSSFGGGKEPLLALSFERQPSRRGRNRPGAVLAACVRLSSGDLCMAAAPIKPAAQPSQPPPQQQQLQQEWPAAGGGSAAVAAAAAAAKAALLARHEAEGLRLQRAMDTGSTGSRDADAAHPVAFAPRHLCTCKWARGRGCGGAGCSAGARTATAAGPPVSVVSGCGVLMAPLQQNGAAGDPAEEEARRNAAALRAQQRYAVIPHLQTNYACSPLYHHLGLTLELLSLPLLMPLLLDPEWYSNLVSSDMASPC